MKLKHQFIILCSIVTAAFIFIAKAHSFEGAYVGGAFGGILSPVNHLGDKLTDIVITGAGMKINEHWYTARKPSLNFSFNGGFGRLFDKHYSGAELSINKSRYRMKITKSHENSDLITKDELNLTLRDIDVSMDYKYGYLISKNTMLFAKTGLARTRARAHLASDSTIKLADANFKHSSTLHKEKIIHPVRLGFGVEHKVYDDISILCDYTYTRYMRPFKLKGQTKTVDVFDNEIRTNHNHKMIIQDTSIMLGLKKYF